MNTFFKSLLISMILVNPAFAGGGSDGGAEDFLQRVDYRWYPEGHKIKFCVDVSPTFGASLGFIEKTLEKAWKTWAYYYKLRKSVFDEKDRIFASQISACDGTENVKFEFGTPLEDQSENKKSTKQLAFAELLEFDKKTAIGRGRIYVFSQDRVPSYVRWSGYNHLLGILLHEIGHTLGVPHVHGTIMDQDVSLYLKHTAPQESDGSGGDGFSPKLLENIDVKKELLPGREFASSENKKESTRPNSDEVSIGVCGKKLYKGLYPSSADVPPGGFNKGLQMLIGREPVGKVRVDVVNGCSELKYKDDKGEMIFIMRGHHYLAHNSIDQSVFKSFGRSGSYRMRSSAVILGQLKGHGRTVQAYFTEDMGWNPLKIQIVEKGRVFPLFRSATPYELALQPIYDIEYSPE